MPRYTAADRVALQSRRVERVYSVLARVYDEFFDWALGPGRRRAVGRLHPRPDQRVLEIGVGTGLSLPHYPPGCHVTGIDISEAMLERARARLEAMARSRVELYRMDARSLAFPDASFDHVIAPYVMSVVPDPERVMSQVVRVCRPGGTIVVLNRFLSSNPLLHWVERALTPATQWLGFRMDLPFERITGAPGVRVVHQEHVNILGLWRLVELERVGRPDLQ
jgi:phosphatidylethanolamine/phosphatidyl-N-methylethanolamine N-methyltransferase